MESDRPIIICFLVLLTTVGPWSGAAADESQPPRCTLRFARPIIRTPIIRSMAHWAPQDLPQVVPAPSPFAAERPQPRSGMTLGELESIALSNNPTLVQAAMQIRAARAKCLQVGLYPNPTIAYQAEEMGDQGTAGQQGGFFGQEIVTAGKLRLRRAVAGHEVRQAEHAWQAQRGRVLNDVRFGWYDVLAAQRAVELNQQLLDIGREGVKAAEDLLAAQEVSRVDLLQARVEAESASIQLSEAQNRYQAAWRRLAAVLGVSDMEPTPLAGHLDDDLPQWTWQDALRHVLAESPELSEARAGLRRARSALARECAERIPNLDVQAGVRHNNATRDTLVGVEFGVPLPIFNRNQGNIRKAQAELIAAEHEVRRVELTLQDRLAAAFERYANAGHRAGKYTTEILPNAKASLELIQTGYRHGEFDYLKLLTAQRTYFRVNLAHLESLLELRSSSLSIEGFLLAGGLGKIRNHQ